MEAVCRVRSCARPVFCRSWCSAHYFRWKKHGDVRADVPVGGRPPPAQCELEACDGAHVSGGLCEMHYRRRLRTGRVRADEPKHGTAEPTPCSVRSCTQPSEARGWCHGHYLRFLRNGDVNADEPLSRRKQPATCTVEACSNDTSAHGLCQTHLHRRTKHGDVRAAMPVRKPRKPPPDDVCLVDRCSLDAVDLGLCQGHRERQRRCRDVLTLQAIRLHTGGGSIRHGYRNITVPPGLRVLTNGDGWVGEHRLMMAIRLERPLEADEVVHHINGVRTDNRIDNLELWSTGHPKGQRITDKVAFALDLLRRYRPDALRENGTEHSQSGNGSPEGI